MKEKKRIAFVNQRYGLEVNGGSEYYTREIAEHLKKEYEVEVLTTKAIDYITWKNEYVADVEEINGVTVRRFAVNKPRDMQEFGLVNQHLLGKSVHTEAEEQQWFDSQGPLCPELVSYISEHKDDYDVWVFVTYLYYLTVMALPNVAEKAILIPTAHDEPYIYFNRFKTIFTAPRAIIYLTDEEKKFVNQLFHNEKIKSAVCGVGIDVPKETSGYNFKKKYQLEDYIVYVGRIDEAKGCKELFQYFLEYKRKNPCSKIKLVLMGKAILDIPKHPDILSLGFVSEEEKFSGIAGSKVLILPSEFESLSISVLEAMALKIPVLVNGKSEVLKGHCLKSNGGLYYMNYDEFEGCLDYLQKRLGIYTQMKENAKEYVDKFFKWDVILDHFRDIISYVSNEQ